MVRQGTCDGGAANVRGVLSPVPTSDLAASVAATVAVVSMLSGVLSLHDVEDVERYCAYLLRRSTRIDDMEDALTWAIERCWALSLRYDPERGSTFANFAAQKIRVADYLREREGRTVCKFKTHTYVRPRPTLVPLDDRPELAATADLDGPSLAELLRLSA